MVVSTEVPPRTAAALQPLPRWAVTRLSSASGRPSRAAARSLTNRWLVPGAEEIRAAGHVIQDAGDDGLAAAIREGLLDGVAVAGLADPQHGPGGADLLGQTVQHALAGFRGEQRELHRGAAGVEGQHQAAGGAGHGRDATGPGRRNRYDGFPSDQPCPDQQRPGRQMSLSDVNPDVDDAVPAEPQPEPQPEPQAEAARAGRRWFVPEPPRLPLPLAGTLIYAGIRLFGVASTAFILGHGTYRLRHWSLLRWMRSNDGGHYQAIAPHGYAYPPGQPAHASR